MDDVEEAEEEEESFRDRSRLDPFLLPFFTPLCRVAFTFGARLVFTRLVTGTSVDTSPVKCQRLFFTGLIPPFPVPFRPRLIGIGPLRWAGGTDRRTGRAGDGTGGVDVHVGTPQHRVRCGREA